MVFSLFILGWIFVVGLVIGSFLNVVILRTVSGESIVLPPSKCPKCQNRLKWYHNIPLLSYLFLGGKCAYCKEHISWQYPFVEFFTGCMFLALFLKICNPIDPLFGLSVMQPIGWFQVLAYIFALIVTGLFIAIAGTDIIEKKVADAHTVPLISIGLIFSLLYTLASAYIYHKEGVSLNLGVKEILASPVVCSFVAGVVGFVVMEIVARLGYLIAGSRAFGEGDSYIAAGLGTVLAGLWATTEPCSLMRAVLLMLFVLVLSVIIQVVVTTPLYLTKLVKNKNWTTFGSLVAFIIYTVSYIFADKLNWLENPIAYWGSTIVLAMLGLFVCKEVLSGLKNKTTDGLYLPFGPAMIAAGFIIMFMMNY